MVFEISGITVHPLTPLVWGVLVGMVFSLVGAAGGILSSVGLISVLGVRDVNLVKPMAQILTLVSPLVSVPAYWRQCRIVISLALLMGAGGIIGALIGSTLSFSYLGELTLFKPFFGALVLFIALLIVWKMISSRRSRLDATDRAAANFVESVSHGQQPCAVGVKTKLSSVRKFVFEFGGEKFQFNPLYPFMVGGGIAIISSAFGVGGGFLLVPYMSIVLRLPMAIIAGTSALAIFIHSVTSIANYMRLGVSLDYTLLALLLGGTILGSYLGPVISRFFKESWFKTILVLILMLIGLRYTGILAL